MGVGETKPSYLGQTPSIKGLVKQAPTILAVLFMLSLLVPMQVPVGPVLLFPYRLLLLLFFLPLFGFFLAGRAGKPMIVDWMMFGSALWAALALVVNNGLPRVIEPMGVHMVEFFGAYMLGRMAIRSAVDFRRFVNAMFFVLLVLAPLAAIESMTERAILLDLFPKSIPVIHIGNRFGMRRAQVVFAHPILFGAFVSTAFGLFWYVLSPFSKRFLGLILSISATVFSLSSGALLSLVCQTVFIVWEMLTKRLSRRWTIFGILAVLAYVGIDLLSNRSPFHVLVTYGTFSTGSAYNRILIWQYGTDNVWANPFFGLGLDIGDWARPRWMGGSVDNFWLLITMQYGLPAIALFLGALFLIVRRVSLANLTNVQDKACRAGYLTALGGIFLAGSTVHYWQSMMAFMLFFFGSGVWMFTGGAQHAASDAETTDPMPAPTSRYTRFPAKTQFSRESGSHRNRLRR